MKHIFIVSLIFTSFSSFAQVNLPLKKGVYKNVREFLDNSPSIDISFTTEVLWQSKDDSSVICASLVPSSKPKADFTPWGFCDGKHVYVAYSDGVRRSFWRIAGIGKTSYFTRGYKIRGPLFIDNNSNTGSFLARSYAPKISDGVAIVGLASAIVTGIASTNAPQLELLVVSEKGVKFPDYKFMKKLLTSFADLLSSFNAEWQPFEKYDYATDELEPDESKAAKRKLLIEYLDIVNSRSK
jgi:hypothetical protein